MLCMSADVHTHTHTTGRHNCGQLITWLPHSLAVATKMVSFKLSHFRGNNSLFIFQLFDSLTLISKPKLIMLSPKNIYTHTHTDNYDFEVNNTTSCISGLYCHHLFEDYCLSHPFVRVDSVLHNSVPGWGGHAQHSLGHVCRMPSPEEDLQCQWMRMCSRIVFACVSLENLIR